MHPEIDITKKIIEAISHGKPFSENTVLECMNQMKESMCSNEKPEVTRQWASYYWSKYELIGQHKLIAISENEDLLRDTLYRYFGK